MAFSFLFAAESTDNKVPVKEKDVAGIIHKQALMVPQWTYTFYTTCGTVRTASSDGRLSDATLKSMMNDFNKEDCGHACAEVEIRDV